MERERRALVIASSKKQRNLGLKKLNKSLLSLLKRNRVDNDLQPLLGSINFVTYR